MAGFSGEGTLAGGSGAGGGGREGGLLGLADTRWPEDDEAGTGKADA